MEWMNEVTEQMAKLDEFLNTLTPGEKAKWYNENKEIADELMKKLEETIEEWESVL